MRFQHLYNFRINGVNSQESFFLLYGIPHFPANIRVVSVVPRDGVQILVEFVQIRTSPKSYAMFYL